MQVFDYIFKYINPELLKRITSVNIGNLKTRLLSEKDYGKITYSNYAIVYDLFTNRLLQPKVLEEIEQIKSFPVNRIDYDEKPLSVYEPIVLPEAATSYSDSDRIIKTKVKHSSSSSSSSSSSRPRPDFSLITIPPKRPRLDVETIDFTIQEEQEIEEEEPKPAMETVDLTIDSEQEPEITSSTMIPPLPTEILEMLRRKPSSSSSSFKHFFSYFL
jgi:hypothetical protein